jgi:hypothetical protein
MARATLLTPAHAEDIQLLPDRVVINEVMSANVSVLADEDDDYPDWIELYNRKNETVNLRNFGLSDDASDPFRWTFPDITIEPQGYLLIFASGKDRDFPNLHTNFKIKSSGETITLAEPSGAIINVMSTGFISPDASRGRPVGGSLGLYYFAEPTPGDANSTQGFLHYALPPVITPASGIYSGGLTIEIQPHAADAVVYYTLDGSEPDSTSYIYTTPITVTNTTVIRAQTFAPGYLPSMITTCSYVFYDNHNLTVLSLVTDPDNLWDDEQGIYVMGSDPGIPPWYEGANFWQDWERPAHIDFIEPDGWLGFSADVGIKMAGGWPRLYAQKSFDVYIRDKYHLDEIEYYIFPELSISVFESFKLRNSGQDWHHTMIRDAALTGLVDNMNLDHMAYRPLITFINGEYWGIYNIREKSTADYLASHHDLDEDNLDILIGWATPVVGDSVDYYAMIQFIETHDMSVPENYELVKTQMDVYNYMDYQAAEIYFDNGDWPANNIKYWRTHVPRTKWQWILFDIDFGFGTYSDSAYTFNTLAFALEPNGPFWPNPPWSTFLFRSLVENEEFKADFINHSADFLNVDFQPDRVIGRIDALAAVIEPEIQSHQERWNRTLDQWYEAVDVMRVFADNRIDCVRAHYEQEFELAGQATVTIEVDPPGAGVVKVNTRIIAEYPWEGIYFVNVPIKLQALPNWGYRFKEWSGVTAEDASSTTLDLWGDVAVTAAFEPDTFCFADVMITEINYNSADNFDPEDWIELYNPSADEVDLSAWIFKDSNDDHVFTFPESTSLEPRQLLVLCRDTTAFLRCFPDVEYYTGNMDFGLSGDGELIRLYDGNGDLVDSLTYDDDPPWPPQPDGNGPTLEMIDLEEPNHDPANWRSSYDPHGSPGRESSWVHIPVAQDGNTLPRRYMFFSPFPNPFNAVTNLSFYAPQEGSVTLILFDLLGKRIDRIVDGYVLAGSHRVQYNAGKLPSGIYLLRMQAGDWRQTQKIILLK